MIRVVRDHGRNQSYGALHYQQEHVEHAAQKHQRAAHEQVEISAAHATSRTAKQMTSRFRDIENNIQANCSHQQPGLLFEITSESAQALEAQRHDRFQDATAEMMRRDTRNQEVVDQLRNALQHCNRH